MIIRKIPHRLIDSNPENSRKEFDAGGLTELAVSLKQGQRVPCIVFAIAERFVLVDGERRWRAAPTAGLDDLDCIVLEKAPTKGELLLTQLAIDAHKAHLTPIERANLYAATLRENNMTAAELHAREGVSQATISKYLSILKCTPQVQEAVQAGKLGVSDCYEISKCPPETQGALLQVKLGGATRDKLANHARGHRNAQSATVRTKRITCPLRSGLTVIVTGNEISLDDVIEALADSQKEAKKARDQSMDVKTFEAVMRDKAKASV